MKLDRPRGVVAAMACRSMCSVVVVLATASAAGTAYAGEPKPPNSDAFAQRFASAISLEQSATALSGDARLLAFDACGEAFASLIESAGADADQVLFNAILCFSAGGSFDRAERLRVKLLTDLPTSRFAATIRWQRGQALAAIGRYQDAAVVWRELADHDPTATEAIDALENAVALGLMIGDDTDAVAAANIWSKRYGAQQPARAFMLLARVARQAAERGHFDAAMRQYRSLVRQYRAIEPTIAITVTLAIAELAWRRSCPSPRPDGLCLRGARGREPAPLEAITRRAADLKVAVRSYMNVVAMTDRGDPTTNHARAVALLRLAERSLEEALAPMPEAARDIAVHGRTTAAAQRQLAAWLSGWINRGTDANAALERVLSERDPAAGITAMADMAMLAASMADTLATAPGPSTMSDPAVIQIYRDQIADVTQPLRTRSEQAAMTCLAQAAVLQIVTIDVDRCGQILERWQPYAWKLDERRATAAVALPPFDLAPIADDPAVIARGQ